MKGYTAGALGKTSSTAFNKCNTTIDPGYDNPKLCNQQVPPVGICDGNMEMVLVNYPMYGRSQYECKQIPPSKEEPTRPE